MKHSICFRWIPCLLLGLTLALPASRAEEPDVRPEPGQRAAEWLNDLAEELGLTDVQKSAVTAIMQKQRDQLKALRDDESLSRRDRMKKVRELREAGRAEIRAQLTPEQQKKFDAMPRERPRPD
jgi:Spy/CpxP family protein refolding chaperone